MKKILGLVAVALISASLITGCGNDKNDSMADTTSQTSQTSNTQKFQIRTVSSVMKKMKQKIRVRILWMILRTELTILWVTEIIITLILSPIPQILFYKKTGAAGQTACCSRF